ncbi:MAG: hypothetical protein PVI91_06895 [Gammaproteobacteria bacterium]
MRRQGSAQGWRRRVGRAASVLVMIPIAAQAYDTRMAGFVGTEVRGFVQDAQFEDQLNGLQPSLVAQPEVLFQSENGWDRFNFIPFARLDGQDDRRTHADIREAYWLHIGEDWELLAGINRVFWGVTEFRHLVDIVNQTDLVEDLDGEDKLGQPMLKLATQQDWGELSFFVLPWFREETFPGKHGRLRFGLVTDGEPEYQSSDEHKHVDFALRYSHYIGAWDIGLSWFKGTGREPRFLLNESFTRLVPFYDLIEQVGADIQYTREGWLWKFEGLWRAQHGDHFLAGIGGFEYTLYQIHETGADLGLLLEYSYDGRDDDPAEAPPVIFDDDFFFGARLTLNDVQDSELLAGLSVDRDDRASQLSLEASRRLDNFWTTELEGRWFLNSGDNGVLSAFKKDSYITLRLLRYF